MNSFLNFCLMNLSVEYLPRLIPQTELVSAIASGASNAIRTDSIYKAVKRKRVQFESGVRKLGGKATSAKNYVHPNVKNNGLRQMCYDQRTVSVGLTYKRSG